jgi:hypothetical protein
MKRFYLDELLMLADKEKAARRVKFHRRVTIIKGPNDTGKSSLMKTIYHTLGAVAPNIHDKWKEAKVRSAVRFTIDERQYTMLKDGDRYTMFDSDQKKLRSFDSVTNALAPYFAELFDFRLSLPTQKGEGKQAVPAFLFLHFYFDQDKSWSSAWAGFERLKQFRSPKRDVVYFHTGIRPNGYYLAKIELLQAEERLQLLNVERLAVERTLERVQALATVDVFEMDVTTYHAEIELLLRECNDLRQHEERIRNDLSEIYVARATIESQIAITANAAMEIGKDFTFAVGALPETVDCPACGAQYSNSFRERFDIAADEDRCRDLLADLKSELRDLDKQLEVSRTSTAETQRKLSSLSESLATKRGEVMFSDVIRSEGRREIRKILRGDLREKDASLGEAGRFIDRTKLRIKGFGDKTHIKSIQSQFRMQMRSFLAQLAVLDMPESRYRSVDASVVESGSDLPRALLAYYFRILHTISAHSTSCFCPIVVDSPKQQDQDDANWKRILEFLKDRQPTDSQMVLALVDDLGISFEGDVVELSDKYHVLSQAEYEAVAAEMRPLMDGSLMD